MARRHVKRTKLARPGGYCIYRYLHHPTSIAIEIATKFIRYNLFKLWAMKRVNPAGKVITAMK